MKFLGYWVYHTWDNFKFCEYVHIETETRFRPSINKEVYLLSEKITRS